MEIASWSPPSVEPEESATAPPESEVDAKGDDEEEGGTPNAARDARENALLATLPLGVSVSRLTSSPTVSMGFLRRAAS